MIAVVSVTAVSDFSELGTLCKGEEYVASSMIAEEMSNNKETNKTISSFGV